MEKSEKAWIKYVTPILVTVNLFVLAGVSYQLNQIDAKLFSHMTNHELHISRRETVTKSEFDIHCQFARDNWMRVSDSLDNLSHN